ncbi:MAG: methyl-accepting chemotaxis protein [Rhodocyclaceae bacterium]|nr:methyl-accepting chemotaxis protein [Rhodocyclaceae bacterium]
MHAIFAPAIALMSRLKYPGKFTLIGLLAFVSIAILLASLAANLFTTIHLTRHELAATDLIRALQKQIQLTQQHRGLSAGFLGGNAAMKAKLEAKQAEVNEAVAAVGAAEARHADVLATSAEWAAIKGDWERLRTALPGMTVSATLAAHSQLIERMLRFQSGIADAGSLNGDPEIDTFYLIDTLVTKLPDMLERLGKMRAKGTGVLARKELTDADRIDFSVHVAILKRTLQTLKLDLEKAGRQTPAIAPRLAKLSTDIAAATGTVIAMIDDDIIPARFSLAPQAYFDKCTQTIDIGYGELYDTLLPTLDGQLNSRIARLQTQLTLQIGLAALFLLLLAYVSLGAYYAIVAAVTELSAGAAAMAGGDLTARIRLIGRDELTAVSASFNTVAETFNDLLRKSQHTSDRLSTAATDLSTSAQTVAASSRAQSDAASSMAAAIEEMTVSIDQIAEHARAAQETSTSAGAMAQEGGRIVDGTVREMEQIAAVVNQSAQIIEQLGRHSTDIYAIVNVIKEIADQTNLLALNAAIEAARAGDQGRGFAVVADEVRKLAERTTQATQEIAGMIGAMQTGTGNAVASMNGGVARVGEGVALSRRAGEAIARIHDAFERVLQAVKEISLALKEQSIASTGVAQSVERIAQMAERNSGSVSATSATARSLESLALEMQGVVRHFRV